MKKPILLKTMITVALFALLALPLFAANSSSGNLKLTLAGPSIEAKLEAGYAMKIPMLEGEGPLFSGNNLKVKGLLGVSPVAGTFSVDAVLTPIAIAEVSLGAAFGTGWDFTLMDNMFGLTVGNPLAPDSLGGMYYKGRAGAALQFDTAAIFPGDWTSVLLRTYHELNYQGYTNAGKDVPWAYELSGAKVNGFNYKGEYLVGYQMPLMVNLVAVQLETYMFDLSGGNDHPFLYDASLIGNLGIASGLDLTMVVQFTNILKDKNANNQLVEQDFTFKRVVLMLNYSF